MAYTAHEWQPKEEITSAKLNAIEQGIEAKAEKGDKGDPGEQGERGEQGIQGERGLQGAPGADGQDGADAELPFTQEQLDALLALISD